MIGGICLAILGGGLFGWLFLSTEAIPLLDEILMSALSLMVFIATIEIGTNRHAVKKNCHAKGLLLMVAIPCGVTVGSLIGGAVAGSAAGMRLYDALLVSAGLGWYSFSSVVISTQYSAEIGTIAFLTNVLREVLSFVLIPLVARYNKIICIGIGGASTMDSTLPVLIRATDLHTGVLGFFNGLVLTLVVPVLITFLLGFKQ